MGIAHDLSKVTFERLTAQWPAASTPAGIHWLCLCSCGVLSITTARNLTSGHTRSCGCLKKDSALHAGKFKPQQPGLRHGHNTRQHRSPTHHSWSNMIQRCTNAKYTQFTNYGGANPPVLVCERWRHSFENFLDDIGERPPRTTLGRFGDTGNYEPGNVQWMSVSEQVANRKPRR